MSITFKEIHDTYPALEKTVSLADTRADGFKKLLDSHGKPVVYIGCGSSYSIAKSLAVITCTQLHRQSFALAGGDLLIHADSYAPCLEGATLVAVSRSGQTSEMLRAVEKLRALGCRFSLVSYCCVEGSPLSKASDLALDMPWAFDASVCQTRCVTCLYCCGAMLVALAAGNAALVSDLRKAVAQGPAYMARIEPQIEQAARGSWTHAVVLGDAEIGGICEEGSLTYKEICQLPSNYYHMLDSRHGPMVLFKKNTLVVIATSGDAMELDLVRDVVRKGAQVIVYSDQPLEIEGTLNIAFGDRLAHIARGIPFLLINQLLSYHKSQQTGVNPDLPDGLDPWIKL